MAEELLDKINLTKLKHSETKTHLIRVKKLTEEFVNAYKKETGKKLSKNYMKSVVNFSVLHDLGKLAIPEKILYKKGPLDQTERLIIETHPLTGSYILQKALDDIKELYTKREIKIAQNIVLFHHEKWDGTGYPNRFKEEEIPLEARIVGIVDVYDALTSKRSYKKAWSNEEALIYIKEQSGKYFDPELISIFLKLKTEKQIA